MSAPSEVWHYDGESAVRRAALFHVAGDRFALNDGAGHPLADLQPRDGRPGEYGLKGRPGWRIGFADGVPDDLLSLLPQPQRYGGGVIDRFGLWPMTAAFAVVAAIAVWGFLRTPALVARTIPTAVEARLGELMVGDMGGRACATPDGSAALAALTSRIGAARDIKVHLVRIPAVNAATLPGGQIVLFDGLIQAARSPDEIAGVLGHEIGHVRNRDVMESLLRQFGLSVILGGMEGHVGSYTNALLAMSYSRDAERRADRYAIGMLQEGKVSPAATADFFTRTAGAKRVAKGKQKADQPSRAERMLGYLSSHPEPGERAKAFIAAAKQGGFTPALDDAQWQALRSMCRNSARPEDGWNF